MKPNYESKGRTIDVGTNNPEGIDHLAATTKVKNLKDAIRELGFDVHETDEGIQVFIKNTDGEIGLAN